jgi:hypothetical protein
MNAFDERHLAERFAALARRSPLPADWAAVVRRAGTVHPHGRDRRALPRIHRRVLVALAVIALVALVSASALAVRGVVSEAERHSARGTPERTVDGVHFSLRVPNTGWQNGPAQELGVPPHSLFISRSTLGPQSAEELIFWAGFEGGGEATPCTEVLGSDAASSADLATAVASAPGTRLVDAPSVATVGGRPAVHVTVRVEESLGCQPGFFFTWPHNPGECWGPCWISTEPGDSITVWIVDVEGKRLFFEAVTKPGAGEWQEINDIVGSIRFD